MTTETALTAADVKAALRAHFDSPRYAVITGVRNDAGWDAGRTCDLLAIGTWKSTGLVVHGVEIKVSRGDWTREIQDPSKAEAFARHCDYWWIAAPAKVVKLEELPATWGLLEIGANVKIRRPATKRENPDPVSRGFLACIARRVTEQSPAEVELAAATKRAEEAARRQRQEVVAREVNYDKERGERAIERLERWRQLTGIMLHDFNIEETAAGIKRYFENADALESARRELERLVKSAREIASAGAAALKETAS